MRQRKQSVASPQPRTPARAPEPTGNEIREPGFLDDLRAFLVPERKWHYIFHATVILAALFYWISSLLRWPDASWAEIIMYRPRGDNQVWPVITALSRLNFGDPTDVVNYGKGIGGFHAVILFPHALAYAVFGKAGYMIIDALLCWLFFGAITLLMRRCALGSFSSLLLGWALTLGSLQALTQKISSSLASFLTLLGRTMTEWDFPSLFTLPIFDKRIPRPMITEILLVLLLYFLLRQWRERGLPSWRRGVAIGALFALLAQGDPYAVVALGLLFLLVMGRTMAANAWTVPWRFIAGAVAAAVVCGAYFVVQLLSQSPEAAVRFGLAAYPRSRLHFLPGYAPLLRVAVVGGLAWAIVVAARRWRGREREKPAKLRETQGAEGQRLDLTVMESLPNAKVECTDRRPDAALAVFVVALVAAAWLAQPLQLFLLGKGAQIFHYHYYTLPTFYAYGVVLLMVHLVRLAIPGRRSSRANEEQPFRGARAVALGVLVAVNFLLAIEDTIAAIASSKTARQEMMPWSVLGDRYRPNFRALVKAFEEHPRLKQARSFATYCHEVNFLLTAFFDKRAYLPDNAFTTLGDAELERRLCEMAKVCSTVPENFLELIQNSFVMNYWLGCAKYWCASDYKFAPETDYTPEQLETVRKMPKQSPFNLVLPQSEKERLVRKYNAILRQESLIKEYPDLIIGEVLLRHQGMVPNAQVYETVYTNEVFYVYARRP